MVRVSNYAGGNKSYHYAWKRFDIGFSCFKRPWTNLGISIVLTTHYFEFSLNLPRINPYCLLRWNRKW